MAKQGASVGAGDSMSGSKIAISDGEKMTRITAHVHCIFLFQSAARFIEGMIVIYETD